MLSPSTKAHGSKTKKELIADLERIERFLEEPRKTPAIRGHSQGPRGGGFGDGETRPQTAMPAHDHNLAGIFEAIPFAIAKYGPDDRLAACNEKYKAMHSLPEELLTPGVEFEQVPRACIDRGLILNAMGREDVFLQERLDSHRNPAGPVVHQWKQGQWLEIREEKTADGGTVCMDIDISEQKLADEARAIGESYLTGVLDAGNIGVWAWDLATGENWVAPKSREVRIKALTNM